VSPDDTVVIEVIGEGKADVGNRADVQPPTTGIVPILTHKLCGKPNRMRVKTKVLFSLQGKGLPEKVKFAKRQAFYNRGTQAVVFVRDSEGGEKELSETKAAMEKGRDAEGLSIPMAIGVAHPCIESWLLTDAAAIRRGLELSSNPTVPDKPESLPAPCMSRKNNPKAALVRAAGSAKKELSAKEKDKIARAMNDLGLLERRCPLGFAPFAEEVRKRIRPLFDALADSGS
jgi:hypothetical protein